MTNIWAAQAARVSLVFNHIHTATGRVISEKEAECAASITWLSLDNFVLQLPSLVQECARAAEHLKYSSNYYFC